MVKKTFGNITKEGETMKRENMGNAMHSTSFKIPELC
jgi:hypothetical protein